MDEAKRKEDISISYISALCAYAGIDYDTITHDEDSTDSLLKKTITLSDGQPFQSQLRVQLKSTSSVSQYSNKGECIIYELKAKNYNDLCTQATTPIILCLLILPENDDELLKWSKEELLIKVRCPQKVGLQIM